MKMKIPISMPNIRWQHTLFVGLLFAVLYIAVDDNNIVARSTESIFYFIAWFGIFATIFLTLRTKFRKREKRLIQKDSGTYRQRKIRAHKFYVLWLKIVSQQQSLDILGTLRGMLSATDENHARHRSDTATTLRSPLSRI